MQFAFESKAIRHDQMKHTILFQVDINRSNITVSKTIKNQVILFEDCQWDKIVISFKYIELYKILPNQFKIYK